MLSLRRVQSSKANGALSKGSSMPAGKERSSLNALRHGLCAKSIVTMVHESRKNFPTLLRRHVEFGLIEEICASYWRQRRARFIETGLLEEQIALQPGGNHVDRTAAAFDHSAASPTLPLYQRAMPTFVMRRKVKSPNDPSPISEHSLDLVTLSKPMIPKHLVTQRPVSKALARINLHSPCGTGLLACRPFSSSVQFAGPVRPPISNPRPANRRPTILTANSANPRRPGEPRRNPAKTLRSPPNSAEAIDAACHAVDRSSTSADRRNPHSLIAALPARLSLSKRLIR
jgi:hypothetical protein